MTSVGRKSAGVRDMLQEQLTTGLTVILSEATKCRSLCVLIELKSVKRFCMYSCPGCVCSITALDSCLEAAFLYYYLSKKGNAFN